MSVRPSLVPGWRRPAFAALVVLAAAAGCRATPAAAPAQSHRPAPALSPSPSAPPPAAALSGGACLLLDYQEINSALGTEFDVAAAASKSGTYTCVIQGGDEYPDLTLSITSTTLTATDFKSDVQPSGSKPVSSLGKVGYSSLSKAASGTGPGIEVGWLSGNDRLIVMRYTAAVGATVPISLTSGMVALARKVDATTV